MGYVYARLIHEGVKTLNDVPQKYKEVTKVAYFDLYGEEL